MCPMCVVTQMDVAALPCARSPCCTVWWLRGNGLALSSPPSSFASIVPEKQGFYASFGTQNRQSCRGATIMAHGRAFVRTAEPQLASDALGNSETDANK